MLRLMLPLVLLVAGFSRAEAQDKKDLPKIVLIGDSIRMGYAPLVAKKLEGKAIIISAKANGGDSGNVLKNLEEWIIQQKPAVVHFNCGLHDLKFDMKTKTHQIELEQYRANLQKIVARLKKETNAVLIFASTTPIDDARHAKRGAGFDRTEADVLRYNVAAVAVMKEARVPINDLHAVVVKGGAASLLAKDGTHFTPEGSQLLADAVVEVLASRLKR